MLIMETYFVFLVLFFLFFFFYIGLRGYCGRPLGGILTISETPLHLGGLENVTRAYVQKAVSFSTSKKAVTQMKLTEIDHNYLLL